MPARKPEQEKEVLDWIEAVLGDPLPEGDFEEVLNIQQIINKKNTLNWINVGVCHFHGSFNVFDLQVLKNGVILCKLMNKISPGAIPKFKEKGMPFILMENIQSFLVNVK